MPTKNPYADQRREQHVQPKIVEVKPAGTVEQAVANAKKLVNKVKS